MLRRRDRSERLLPVCNSPASGPVFRWDFPRSAWRFAVLSVFSFWLNEVGYAAALRWTTLDYRAASCAVIVLLAAVQLLASKHWAFAARVALSRPSGGPGIDAIGS